MLNYLADLYLQEGQLAQAEAAIRESLQTRPAADPCSGSDLMILAKVLSKQGRHRDAYEAGRKALRAFRQRVGTDTEFFRQTAERVDELRKKATHKEVEVGASTEGNPVIGGDRNRNNPGSRGQP
jgi:tetratricopeptide (TPR) repeat protein